jgi:hypothetical protein
VTSRLGTGKSLTLFTSRLGTEKWQTFFTVRSTENAELKKHKDNVCMLAFWLGEYCGGALCELLKRSDIYDSLYKKLRDCLPTGTSTRFRHQKDLMFLAILTGTSYHI